MPLGPSGGSDPKELGKRLYAAPFDVIVLVLSTVVTDNDAIHEYLSELSHFNPYVGEDITAKYNVDVLKEKTVRVLGANSRGNRVFVALNKQTIKEAVFGVYGIKHREGLDVGTLKVTVEGRRQRMTHINVGIIDVRTNYCLSKRHGSFGRMDNSR